MGIGVVADAGIGVVADVVGVVVGVAGTATPTTIGPIGVRASAFGSAFSTMVVRELERNALVLSLLQAVD